MPAASQHRTGVPGTIPKVSRAVAGTGDGDLETTPGGRMLEVVGVPGGGAQKELYVEP